MIEQQMLEPDKDYLALDEYFMRQAPKKILLVCGKSVSLFRIGKYFEVLESRLDIHVVTFQEFAPNPTYESVERGVRCFKETGCEMIVAVGGGSAMDVAKCIKIFVPMDPKRNYLEQEIKMSRIPLLAVPTTAGTGSEVTRYAVIYFRGEKQSVTHEACIPDAVMLDASMLESLPVYQRKVTCMDAFCHALESYWSINSTEESREYAGKAIGLIMEYGNGYLGNQRAANEKMLTASHLAGRAINITQTTAGHALCYKLTSLYGIAHGHAAALCVMEVWRYMIGHLEECIDVRGQDYLKHIFVEIADFMGCKDAKEALEYFEMMIKEMQLEMKMVDEEINWKELVYSVNLERLRNNPVFLTKEAIDEIYHRILI